MSPSVESPLGTLGYFEEGSGPALVLIHGWPFNRWTFRPLVRLLRDEFRCIGFDLLGIGDSRRAGSGAAMEEQADALLDGLRTLGVERFFVLAQDTGGIVARLMAARAASQVDGLILINTEMPGHRPPWVPLFQTTAHLPFTKQIFSRVLRFPPMLKSPMGFGNCFCDRSKIFGEFHQDIITPMIHDAGYMDGIVKFLDTLDWEKVDALLETHREIKAQVSLIWGEQDPFFPISLAKKMFEQFGNRGRFVPVEGTKLLPYYEKPDVVAKYTKEILLALAEPARKG